MVETNVYLRKLKETKTVSIRENFTESIEPEIIQKWQDLIDLVADILDVKSGLIMKITKNDMQVFLKSSNEDNPYEVDGKDHLGHGLYCETVIGSQKELFVENALDDEDWKDNPDVDLDMISYLGYPIRYPNGDFFGTICVLDDEPMKMGEKYKRLIQAIRNSIETDIALVETNHQLIRLANIDTLTQLPNRKKIKDILEVYDKEIHEGLYTIAMAMIDMDGLKNINDQYGHDIGDKVLEVLGKIIKNHLKEDDFAGRLSGDEFIFIVKNQEKMYLEKLLKKILHDFQNDPSIKEYAPSFSFGITEMKEDDHISDILRRADHLMYAHKKETNNGR